MIWSYATGVAMVLLAVIVYQRYEIRRLGKSLTDSNRIIREQNETINRIEKAQQIHKRVISLDDEQLDSELSDSGYYRD